MPDLLISGPAGAGKSAAARRELEESSELTVAADFQSIYAALTLQQRGPDGRYPLRDNRLLPLAEYVRRAVVTGARSRDIRLVATNSDGDPGRRRFLLGQLGLDAREIIVDPGEEIIRARLADSETGELSEECDAAALRWYGRLGDCLMSNVETRAVEIRLAEDLARRGPASSGAHCSPTGSGPLTVPSGSRWAPCPGLTGASYLESSITGKRR